MLGLGVGGCTSQGCGSGADSAPDAVSAFLEAALTASTEDDICRWVPPATTAAALRLARELAASVQAVGVDALLVTEAPSEQLGSLHIVRVAGGDLPYRTFYVLDEEGRFVVAQEESMEASTAGE